jgi:hypothetical protein
VHRLLAPLRHLHGFLYRRGPELVPLAMGHYGRLLLLAVSLLLLAAAALELPRSRTAGGLWFASALALYAAAASRASLARSPLILALAVAAIACGLGAFLVGMVRELRPAQRS